MYEPLLELHHDNKLAALNRPFWTESVSGDAIVFKAFGEKLLLAVIDGTGHGHEAHSVSSKMAEYIDNLPECTLPHHIIQQLHGILEPCIGASVGIAVLDTVKQEVTYSGVGNISAYILGHHDHSFSSASGTVGNKFRRIPSETRTLMAGDLIILHSDGIKSRFYTQFEVAHLKQSVRQILRYIFSNFEKKHDDASCIVYRF